MFIEIYINVRKYQRRLPMYEDEAYENVGIAYRHHLGLVSFFPPLLMRMSMFHLSYDASSELRHPRLLLC